MTLNMIYWPRWSNSHSVWPGIRRCRFEPRSNRETFKPSVRQDYTQRDNGWVKSKHSGSWKWTTGLYLHGRCTTAGFYKCLYTKVYTREALCKWYIVERTVKPCSYALTIYFGKNIYKITLTWWNKTFLVIYVLKIYIWITDKTYSTVSQFLYLAKKNVTLQLERYTVEFMNIYKFGYWFIQPRCIVMRY